MGRLLTGLLAMALAVAPAAAQAKDKAASPPGAQKVQKVKPSSQRIVQGTVSAIDLSRGTVTMDADGKPLEINALPRQLAALKPGDLVSINYKNYDGIRWIRMQDASASGTGGSGSAGVGGTGTGTGGLGLSSAGEPIPRDAFGQYGSASGYVDRLNKKAGRLTVRGLDFRSHPEMLDSVLPGQFVTVDYEEIGGVAWTEKITVVSTEPAPAEPKK